MNCSLLQALDAFELLDILKNISDVDIIFCTLMFQIRGSSLNSFELLCYGDQNVIIMPDHAVLLSTVCCTDSSFYTFK